MESGASRGVGIDRAGGGIVHGVGAGRSPNTDLREGALSAAHLPSVRQLRLSGPPFPGEAHEGVGGVFALSQYRRELGERGGAALVSQRSAASRKGAFACRAGRHPRVHRGAAVLPRSLLHPECRVTARCAAAWLRSAAMREIALPSDRNWTAQRGLHSEAGKFLHAPQQALVFAAFRENFGDVGALEAAALWRGDEQVGNVLPPFILLERFDLAVQAEEVIG